MDRLGRVLDRLQDVMAVLAGLLLLFVTFSISYSILVRALGLQGPVWIVQFNEYSLLWITFLGAAWLLRRGKHVTIDSVIQMLGPRAKAVMTLAHAILGLLVCSGLAWFTGVETWSNYTRGVVVVQAVNIPKHLVIAIIPFGFGLLAVQFGRDMARAAMGLRKSGGEQS